MVAYRLEKPRVDFRELVIHHIVTLWLVGWSYTINLTNIGIAVFVSMDIPDVFLAVSRFHVTVLWTLSVRAGEQVPQLSGAAAHLRGQLCAAHDRLAVSPSERVV